MTQTKPDTREQGSQTDTTSKLELPAAPKIDTSLQDSFLSDISEPDHRNDSDWLPDDSNLFSADTSSDEDATCFQDKTNVSEQKFIVFESCLDSLVDKCVECGSSTYKTKVVSGSYV